MCWKTRVISTGSMGKSLLYGLACQSWSMRGSQGSFACPSCVSPAVVCVAGPPFMVLSMSLLQASMGFCAVSAIELVPFAMLLLSAYTWPKYRMSHLVPTRGTTTFHEKIEYGFQLLIISHGMDGVL